MQLADDLRFVQIHWVCGSLPKGHIQNHVHDAPCGGWQHAFILTGEKRSTIFCPYSFQAFSVPNDCKEIECAKEARSADDWLKTYLPELLNKQWEWYQSHGYQKDYDTAVLVFKRLGLEVPAQIMTGGEEDDRKKGGKDVGDELIKPVKAKSKRGKFLKYFLDANLTRSVRETVAELSMTRSNVLSYLHMLNKDHGLGYELLGDTVTIKLPEGCTNPSDDPSWVDDDDDWLEGEAETETKDDDDDWLG